MSIPCKDCIVYPVCRSQIKNMRQNSEITELCKKCSIIRKYIWSGGYYQIWQYNMINARKFFELPFHL